jgi:hypothetical protein
MLSVALAQSGPNVKLNSVVPDPNDIPSETLNVRVDDPGVADPSAKGVIVKTLES